MGSLYFFIKMKTFKAVKIFSILDVYVEAKAFS